MLLPVVKGICFVARLAGIYISLFRHEKFPKGLVNTVFHKHVCSPDHPHTCYYNGIVSAHKLV